MKPTPKFPTKPILSTEHVNNYLADQTKLLNVAECIENRLAYFDDVDRFSKVIRFVLLRSPRP